VHGTAATPTTGRFTRISPDLQHSSVSRLKDLQMRPNARVVGRFANGASSAARGVICSMRRTVSSADWTTSPARR
jgi:hypothetical protein